MVVEVVPSVVCRVVNTVVLRFVVVTVDPWVGVMLLDDTDVGSFAVVVSIEGVATVL